MNRRSSQFTPGVWVLIVTIPLVLIAVVVTAMSIDRVFRPPVPSVGAPGAGDRYFPTYGAGGYDALKYTIDLAWDEKNRSLSGTTIMTARATQDLDAFHVDLALTVDGATVDGQEAAVRTGAGTDRLISPRNRIRAGREFTVITRYHGQPGSYIAPDGAHPWLHKGREILIAGEPEASVTWFPANDHPSDPALMEVKLRVPNDLQAISVGRLVSRDADTDPATATWHWMSDEPMTTYLNFVGIGQYDIAEGSEDGRPYVYAVSKQLNSEGRANAMAGLRQTAKIIRNLEKLYGPYPFSQMGGFVPGMDTKFGALENQTRPVYTPQALRVPPANSEWIMVHELAHMWFGDNVTIKQWDDIVMNEGYATHTEWLYNERYHSEPARQVLLERYEAASAGFWRPRIDDPKRENLFGTVYTRGGMALEALRRVIGNDAYLSISREWAQNRGTRSLEEWQALVQQRTGKDLTAFFKAWYSTSSRPARTAENGLK